MHHPTPLPGYDPRLLAELARAWVDSTLIGMYVLRDGAFVWVNRQFLRSTGYLTAELIGRPALSLVHPSDQSAVRAHARAMLQGHATTAYEYRFLTATGESRWALETVASVSYSDARLTIGNFLDITSRKELEAQLHHQAFHDPLTGLPNRALLLEQLTRALAVRPAAVAVLYCDLDDFKTVNDRYGHHAGDALLVEIGQRLHSLLASGATLARLGGDEFVVVLEGSEDAGEAERVAGQVLAAVRQPCIVTGHAVQVTISIGIALGQEPAEGSAALLRRADVALYRAKTAGKARAVTASGTGNALHGDEATSLN